ncbi:cupin domain-containing protein [Paeniglutamicibacter sp. MACA_103]|uniref:cupin domain-containing protein n=1 Tax=Paeniglutamicibacter sp. MACA_103 TaxID=3377337 RepID=UPI003892EB42
MDTNKDLHAIIRQPDEGERRWFFGGGVHVWKATEAQTSGAYLLFEDQLEKGKDTPLHTHPESDETMIVLSGEIVMHLDGSESRIGAGGLVMAPRGMPHAFKVTADATRVLCLHTPGRSQAFYMDASRPLEDGDPGSGEIDFGRVMESARRNGGIEILGPSPFAAEGP